MAGEGAATTRTQVTTAARTPARPSARTKPNSISSIPIGSCGASDRGQNAGALNEKKSLVYFASGLRLNGVDNQAQLQATVNAAIRAMCLSRRSMRAALSLRPSGRCHAGIARRRRNVFRRSALANTNNFAAIAGHAVYARRRYGRQSAARLQRTDRGHRAAQQAISSYYIIGYYTTNEALDGKFRRVKIALTATPRPS